MFALLVLRYETENGYDLSATDGLPTQDDEQNRTEQNATQSCGESKILDSTSWQTHRLTDSHQGHSLYVQEDVICKDFLL